MIASYPVVIPAVNASDNFPNEKLSGADNFLGEKLSGPEKSLLALPPRVASFYRWLHRWHGQTEDIHASTPYFARKQKVSERTIYRWLALLKALGYVSTEVDPGVERRITPEQEPPPARRRGAKMSGVCQGSVSGVRTSEGSNALDASTPEVAALCAEGVPVAVAVQVVQKHPAEAVRRAVSAYRQTKNIRNPVGWLISAVERRYQFVPQEAPEGRTEARRVSVAVPSVTSVNGLQGRAAFDALRSRLALGGRVSP